MRCDLHWPFHKLEFFSSFGYHWILHTFLRCLIKIWSQLPKNWLLQSVSKLASREIIHFWENRFRKFLKLKTCCKIGSFKAGKMIVRVSRIEIWCQNLLLHFPVWRNNQNNITFFFKNKKISEWKKSFAMGENNESLNIVAHFLWGNDYIWIHVWIILNISPLESHFAYFYVSLICALNRSLFSDIWTDYADCITYHEVAQKGPICFWNAFI